MERFLVTGGAGFIGSTMVRALLAAGKAVRVIDNLSTGHRANLTEVADAIEFVEGDIRDRTLVDAAMAGMEYCLHQAAIPSVPRSVADPTGSNSVNVDGSINIFLAARDAGVRRVVFASSSSVYGNAHPMPLVESCARAPISPYGVSKAAMEMYAEVFADLYDLDLVALRYFNVFGPRQDPKSPYAAVIPIFLSHLKAGAPPPVHGDGRQARDFTYVGNVAQANLAACAAPGPLRGVFNIACGNSISVLELLEALQAATGIPGEPVFTPARAGDIRQSWAAIDKAQAAFGYAPPFSFKEGLAKTVAWYEEAS